MPLLLGVILLPLLLVVVGVRREDSAVVGAGGGREGGRASLSCGSGEVSATVTTGGAMVSCGHTDRGGRRNRIV